MLAFASSAKKAQFKKELPMIKRTATGKGTEDYEGGNKKGLHGWISERMHGVCRQPLGCLVCGVWRKRGAWSVH